ncbi:MbcA/ParS/Xre antitoxin family protein [Paracraurococcus lichenis]|uniref:MbcA/ParS/Xre antitoxin family protein n=1 Tax=Paracraurococcus lichenis TaxID=3064888 RepID=A0ABT9ECZ5_9PROT|nr:MbcA/ParS/Xre antitoxin family protein [Paracraurococcus sp. LOR1-02]MDO9714082.1 MbcA/ParS/Xre antitoxin family protein [Paracraurococcus sp. LOR1-02]
MNVNEFLEWQHSEPDLHELIDGEPVRASDEKQAARRILRVLAAAAKAIGSTSAGQRWLEELQPETGFSPIEVAEAGWGGVLSCLMTLENRYPGCTAYDSETAAIRIDAPADLLAEAKRYAEIENRRRHSGPGLRIFLAIADFWGLDNAQRRRMLGEAPDIDKWIQAAQEHRPLDLPQDVLQRTDVIVVIYGWLAVLLTTDEEGVKWLRTPHGAAVFGGKPPLDLITDRTPEGPLAVLGYLQATRHGIYMPPRPLDRVRQPLNGDDIDSLTFDAEADIAAGRLTDISDEAALDAAMDLADETADMLIASRGQDADRGKGAAMPNTTDEASMDGVQLRATIHFGAWRALSPLLVARNAAENTKYETAARSAWAEIERFLDEVEADGEKEGRPLVRPPPYTGDRTEGADGATKVVIEGLGPESLMRHPEAERLSGRPVRVAIELLD